MAGILCGFLLAGCDAVEDVLDAPTIAAPTPTAVLQGTVTGLGTRRPVVLQNNGVSDQCPDRTATAENAPKAECRFFGVQGQDTSAFSFGSVPVGTPYHITVKTQPFARICTVANGTGTVGVTGAAPIAVTCVPNPAVPRYSVSGTIAPAASAIPGLKVTLTTEDGVREIAATGLTQFTFPDAIFNSGATSLPVFTWTVTATSPEGGTEHFCNVTDGTNDAGDDTVAPTGPVTNVHVVACRFDVAVAIALDAGQPDQPLGGGMKLALRHQRTGVDVQELDVDSFSTVAFTDLRSNQDAIYELVITQQPAGQACAVGSGSQVRWGGAVLLINPTDTQHRWSPSTRNVRCRAIPPVDAQLRGSYQQTTIVTTATNTTETLTRNFLTFFDNGTFLYGTHGTGVACSNACGVEYGFYVYDSAVGTITFTSWTDTSGPSGLSSNGAARTLTSVVKSHGSTSMIEALFSTSATTTINWRLIEPASVEGQMTGTWATADNRRVWIFNGSTYAGFHAGVNGLANAQDGCFNIDDVTAPSGHYTRRGNATTCQLVPGLPASTNVFSLDVPNANTTPRNPEGFTGKWPASSSQADGRPSSPVNFTIVPGTPDTLTIRSTLNGYEEINGVPVAPPIVFLRTRAN